MRSKILLLTIAIAGLLFRVPGNPDGTLTNENTPTLVLDTKPPELLGYLSEFSLPFPKQTSSAKPILPFNHEMLQGEIDYVDYHVGCRMWLIQSHSGREPLETPRLHCYSEEVGSLEEVEVYAGMKFYSGHILRREDSGKPVALVRVWPAGSEWYEQELWTKSLPNGRAARLTAGGVYTLAPNRSKAAFWRADGKGYHSLHVWDSRTENIDHVISMWEEDPGSGTSWRWRWSADSMALNIRGTCNGFELSRNRGRREFDLVYLLSKKQIFHVPSGPGATPSK
jgi:hypothetical protein